MSRPTADVKNMSAERHGDAVPCAGYRARWSRPSPCAPRRRRYSARSSSHPRPGYRLRISCPVRMPPSSQILSFPSPRAGSRAHGSRTGSVKLPSAVVRDHDRTGTDRGGLFGILRVKNALENDLAAPSVPDPRPCPSRGADRTACSSMRPARRLPTLFAWPTILPKERFRVPSISSSQLPALTQIGDGLGVNSGGAESPFFRSRAAGRGSGASRLRRDAACLARSMALSINSSSRMT